MSARTTAGTQPTPSSPHTPAPLTFVLAILGLGVLFGLMWSARNTGSTVTEWQVFLARFSSMGAFVALALATKNRAPNPRAMLLLAAVCLAVHIGCDGLSIVLHNESEQLALGAVSVAFEGVGVAVMQLLYLQLFTTQSLQRAIVAVASAYVVAELTYFALLLAPLSWVSPTARVGELACLGLLVWLRLAHRRASAPTPVAHKPLESPALGGAPLAIVVAFIVCLTTAWGFFAQMTGDGAYAFFDTTSEIAMIAVRLLLVALCLQLGATVRFERLAVTLAMLWATGILLVGLLWGTVAPSTSALVIKAGLYALQEFALVLVVRLALHRPDQFFYVGGLVMGALMFAHVSRLGMLVVFSNTPVAGAAAVGVLTCAAWFVAAALGIVALGRSGTQEAPTTPAAAPGDRGLEFHRRFERFCAERGLSEREHDVLLETLHGYTVDAVAEKLCISRETVKTYLSRIYSRAGVSGRQELLGELDRD